MECIHRKSTAGAPARGRCHQNWGWRWHRPLAGVKNRRLLVIAAAAFLAAPGALLAQPTPTVTAPVTIHAHVDRKEVTIGDPIRYTVEISAAPDTEVVIPVLSGTLGDFSITDFGDVPPHKQDGRVVTTRWYTLTIFDTGDHLIPAPKVSYRLPGEELKEAQGEEVLVGVASLLAKAKDAHDIRDIKPPEELPFDWRPYGIVLGALIGVGLLGVGCFYLLNRPRRQRIVPPRPAHEVALAALNRLRSQKLIEQGRFEQYYVQLSSIVRQYLENGFNLRAPEMTTEEFLTALASDRRLNMPHRRLLSEFLSQADLVKFARHLPSLKDSEAAYEAARRFIEESRPAPPSLTPEVQHAAA